MSATMPQSMPSAVPEPARLLVGIDLVQLSRIEESVARFGERFGRRLLTDAEFEFVRSAPALCTQRLGARFAAKEATLKALRLANIGVSWKSIEVVMADDGACGLVLSGVPQAAAETMGVEALSLSLAHEGDYAMAIVVGQMKQPALRSVRKEKKAWQAKAR